MSASRIRRGRCHNKLNGIALTARWMWHPRFMVWYEWYRSDARYAHCAFRRGYLTVGVGPGGEVPGPGGTGLLAGAGGDDRGALGVSDGVFGQGEDVPRDVGAGDGLYDDPVAGVNVPGERAVGQLDGPQRIPVEPAGGEYVLRRAEVLANAAEVGDQHGAEEAEQQPRPG